MVWQEIQTEILIRKLTGCIASFGQDIDTNFIMGLGKVKDKIIILLDIEKVLTAEDLEIVKQAASK